MRCKKHARCWQPGNYAGATEAVSGLDAQIRSETHVVEAAITLRTARRPAKKH